LPSAKSSFANNNSEVNNYVFSTDDHDEENVWAFDLKEKRNLCLKLNEVIGMKSPLWSLLFF